MKQFLSVAIMLLVLVLAPAAVSAQTKTEGRRGEERSKAELTPEKKGMYRDIRVAHKVDRDKAALDRVEANVGIYSVGDVATGYLAGGRILLIELVAFPEGAEENSSYYFVNNQLLMVKTTVNTYTENLFQPVRSDNKEVPASDSEKIGGSVNEEGAFVTDWDWGVDTSKEARDATWTDPAYDMFSSSVTTHYHFRSGKLVYISDTQSNLLETDLDSQIKLEEEMMQNALRMRQVLQSE